MKPATSSGKPSCRKTIEVMGKSKPGLGPSGLCKDLKPTTRVPTLYPDQLAAQAAVALERYRRARWRGDDDQTRLRNLHLAARSLEYLEARWHH